MKKLIKILSVFLAVIMAFASTSVAFASTKFYSKYDDKTYTHNTKFDTLNKVVGIDVSMHNKTVDFNKVKADGIDFVYVRVGYTGYTKKKLSLNYDPNYQENITNALAAGLRSQDTNLMITILFIATLCVDEFLLKKKKVGVKKNA